MTMKPGSKAVKKLYRIVAHHENRRPRAWIAREEGITASQVTAVLKVAGYDPRDKMPLDTYDMIDYLVGQGASLSEIGRTVGADSRTVKKWFPHSAQRLGSEDHREAIRMGLQMRDIERRDLL